jgi:hypothetical protein
MISMSETHATDTAGIAWTRLGEVGELLRAGRGEAK